MPLICSFRTLFDPTLSKKGPGYSTEYRRSGQPPDTGRRIGRVGGLGGGGSSKYMYLLGYAYVFNYILRPKLVKFKMCLPRPLTNK